MRKVFLSSTAKDLGPYRQAVYDALLKVKRVDVQFMKDWVAQPSTSLEVCRNAVHGCDIFVGLIGHCFGSAPESQPDRSYTMLEYDWAAEIDKDENARELPRLMHVAPERGFDVDIALIRAETPEQQAAQIAFRSKDLKGWHTGQPDAWENPDRLASHVVIAVEEQITRLEAAAQKGFTRDAHAVATMDRRDRILALLEAEDAERDILLREKSELEGRLANLDESFMQARETIEGLQADLARYGEELDPKLRADAQRAVSDGDFEAAEELYKKITEHGEAEVKRIAAAYFQRGKIAEERVHWHDAAALYDRASQLHANYDHLMKAREFRWRAGYFHRAAQAGEAVLDVAWAEFGEISVKYADALNDHAVIISDVGREDEAERLYRRALEIYEQTAGVETHDYSVCLGNLAGLVHSLGRLEEAEAMIRRAIEIDNITIGKTHVDAAISLKTLASLLSDQQRFDEAEELCRRAIEIDKLTVGEVHPAHADSLLQLAQVLFWKDEFTEAETSYRKSIEIARTTIGTSHPDFATYLQCLAAFLIYRGEYEQVRGLHDEAVQIRRKRLGDENPTTRSAAAEYARFLSAHGDGTEDTAALDALKAVFGDDIGADDAVE